MKAILVALLLVPVLGFSANVAFADENGSDHYDVAGSPEVVQAAPVQPGTIAGPENAPAMPAIEPEHDNG